MQCDVRFLLCEVFNHTFTLLAVHVLVFELNPAAPRHCPDQFLFADTYLETCQCLDALQGNPYAPVFLALVGSTVLALLF